MNEVLNNTQIEKVRSLVKYGIDTLEQIKELRENLSEEIKKIEEETGLSKKILRKTIRVMFTVKNKNNMLLLEEEKNIIDIVESIMD
jgi:hypothetical protein